MRASPMDGRSPAGTGPPGVGGRSGRPGDALGPGEAEGEAGGVGVAPGPGEVPGLAAGMVAPGDGDAAPPRISSSCCSSAVASVDAVPASALAVPTPMPSENVATRTVSAPAMARLRRGSVPIPRPWRNGSSTQRWVAAAAPMEARTRSPRAHHGSFMSSATAGRIEQRPVPQVERVRDPPEEARDRHREPASRRERGLAEAARDHQGAADGRKERRDSRERRPGAQDDAGEGNHGQADPCQDRGGPRRDPGKLGCPDGEEGPEAQLPGPGREREERPRLVRLGEVERQQERADRDEPRHDPDPAGGVAPAPGDQEDDRRPEDVELLLHAERPEVEDRRRRHLRLQVVGGLEARSGCWRRRGPRPPRRPRRPARGAAAS